MTKHPFARSVAVVVLSGITLGGPGFAECAFASAMPCGDDATEADFCGWGGGGGGGGRSPYGSGPGQVNLLPGVTQNGPTKLGPGAGRPSTPALDANRLCEIWRTAPDKRAKEIPIVEWVQATGSNPADLIFDAVQRCPEVAP